MKNTLISLCIVGLLSACSNPAPTPVSLTFSVNGKSIKIDGTIKAGSKVTAEQAKAALQTAVSILEK